MLTDHSFIEDKQDSLVLSGASSTSKAKAVTSRLPKLLKITWKAFLSLHSYFITFHR